MNFFRDWELEIKLMLVMIIFFTIFGWYMYKVYCVEFDGIVSKGVDKELMLYFRKKFVENPSDEDVIKFLERRMQIEVAAPFIVRTQKNYVLATLISLLFFLILIISVTLIRLTAPLKKLAKHVEAIGRGEFANINTKGSGLIGKLQKQTAHMQDELLALREREQIAATEKAWQDIARVMAHEIKNPLTPMRLLIDKIEEKNALNIPPSPEELTKFTERMNRQLNALEILVNKFRSFSKSQEAVLSVKDIYSAILDNADDFQHEITTNISGHENTNALFDKNFLEQILLNIYKNSVIAGAHNMSVSIVSTETQVKITLQDDGKGIEQEKLDRIFLPYITFNQGGSGIGLSVVKNLIEKMEGSCSVASKVGHGFGITITLRKGEQLNG